MKDGRRTRLTELDLLRGLAILLVVFGHAMQRCTDMVPTHPLQILLATFWMPLFFIIAGFSEGLSCGTSLTKKAKKLLLPYFVWTQILYVHELWCGAGYSVGGHLEATFCSQFWFLRLLFAIWLPVWAFRTLFVRLPEGLPRALRVALAAGGSAVALVGVANIPGCCSVVHYIPLFLLGVLIERTYARIDQKMRLGVVAILSFVYFVQCVWVCSHDMKISWVLDKSMALTGSAFALAVVCLGFSRLKRDGCACRFLMYAGRNSLALYALHWCLFFWLGLLSVPQWFGRCETLIAACGVFVIWCGLSVVLDCLLSRVLLLRVFLLGKK